MARCTVALVGVNRKLAAYYFHRLRAVIAHYLEPDGEISDQPLQTLCRQVEPHHRHRENLETGKRHMLKFNGVPKDHFPLFLKECEGRFKNPYPQVQLRRIKQQVRENLV